MLLSESSTQTDPLSISSICDLSTQTELSDFDQSENLVEPTSSSSESLPSSSSSSSSLSSLSSSSSSNEEAADEVSRRSRSEPAEKGKSSMNSVYSCGLELEKRGREVPNVANAEGERSSIAYLSVSEFNNGSNDAEEEQTNQPPLVPPLTLKVQTDGNYARVKKTLRRVFKPMIG